MNKGTVSLPKLTVPLLAITPRKNTLLLCGPVPRLTQNTAPTRDQESEHGSGKTQVGSQKGPLFSVLILEGQPVPNFPGHLRGCPPTPTAQSHPQQSLPAAGHGTAHPGTAVHLPLHSAHTPPGIQTRCLKLRPRKPQSCWL